MSIVVKDNVVACYASVGVRNYLRLNLSPDPSRQTDEWRVDPTSKQLTINNNPIAEAADLFSQLLQARTASIEATYDGGFDGAGTPYDRLTVANFTIVTSPLAFQTVVPAGGNKQKTFALESFKCVVGRLTHLGMVPRSGSPLTVNPATCAIVADDNPVKDTRELMSFLLSRLHVNATPYLDNGNLVKLELETDV